MSAMFDVVTLGEALIDMVATARNVSLYDAPAFEPKAGGAPTNVAVGVARLGRQAAFVGKVGRDSFGQGLRALLEREGVDVRGMLTDSKRLTTLAFVSLSDSGDPSFAFYEGAHAALTADELPDDLLSQTHIFHCGSVSLVSELSRSATFAAIARAKAGGSLFSYDINWRPALWEGADTALAASPLAQADIIKLSESELALLTGKNDVETALRELPYSAPLILITLGARGCTYRYRGALAHADAPQVAQVVDATGAGDAFMAAILAGVCDLRDQGYPITDLPAEKLGGLVERACRAGALATQVRGAIPSLPYAAQLA
ncbi:MAG: carbohydrate kinase [Candidatus Thermofonsia Clade 1 bacterium]|uniref:Carbohydrate kinase n=1 Tax=Candidatus Thermofonsia Clade 1 bacterium TaxID=2364210 RepID=A0A2M8P2D1_9CHLR|nr:MAG: carbohydrate kinase [Candidatus Thermofonsia Clade 1 bacterium]